MIESLQTILRNAVHPVTNGELALLNKYALRAADQLDEQAAEIERLKEAAARADTQAAVLRTVERWANHHARKPATTAEEALGVIQHHPAIRAITASYADGVVPDTPDPYAEITLLSDALEMAVRRNNSGKQVMDTEEIEYCCKILRSLK